MKRFLSLCAAAILPALPASADVKLSERLTRIAGHLGEGGVHFSVTDSQDDLKDLAGLLDKFLSLVPKDELPARPQFETLLDDLGLYALQGRGSSAHQVGDLWHNRSFMLTNGKHEGVLSLLGDEAEETVAREFAPAGADLVLETSLNLREVERMARKISRSFGDEAEEEFGATFSEEVTNLGLSLAEIFADFTVHGTLVFWLDEEKTFEMGPESEFPVPHFAARLDNAGMVWNLLKAELGADSLVVEKGDETILTPKDAREESPFGVLELRFVWNASRKQLFFSLNEEDLATCRGKGARITDDAGYTVATTGFPQKTSGLAYASKDFLSLAIELAKQFSSEVPPEGQEAVHEIMPYLEKLAKRGGYAGAFAVGDDVFLFLANLPVPVKGDSPMMGLGGVTAVATLAGIATPLILKAKKAGDDTRTLANLKTYASAQLSFHAEFGKYAASTNQLVEKGYLPREVVSILAESGFESFVDSDFEPNQKAIMGVADCLRDPDSVLVVRSDGSASRITLEELEAQLEKQGE